MKLDPTKQLNECTIDELVAYLGSRCPSGVIFGGLVPDDDNSVNTYVQWGGNRAAALGLCDMTKEQVISGWRIQCEGPPPPEEDEDGESDSMQSTDGY